MMAGMRHSSLPNLLTLTTQLFTAYCQKQGQDASAVAFLFDGNRLRPESTPASEDMEVCGVPARALAEQQPAATTKCSPQDEDVIDVVLHQVGGSMWLL